MASGYVHLSKLPLSSTIFFDFSRVIPYAYKFLRNVIFADIRNPGFLQLYYQGSCIIVQYKVPCIKDCLKRDFNKKLTASLERHKSVMVAKTRHNRTPCHMNNKNTFEALMNSNVFMQCEEFCELLHPLI